MITNISLVTLYVTDQDAAKRFYVDVLGFEAGADVTMGDGFRWVTVHHPGHPELQVTLMRPGPPLDAEMAEAVRRALASGSMGGFGITTDDCHADYERLRGLGVEFVSPPAERPSSRRCCATTPATGWSWSSRSRTTARSSRTRREQRATSSTPIRSGFYWRFAAPRAAQEL